MKTKVTELLGIEYPIIQGGMAWVADNHIAAAVSEDRKSTRLNSSHVLPSRMPSSA